MERPAADGEEAEKANGHAEVANHNMSIQIQVFKKKYTNTHANRLIEVHNHNTSIQI